MMLFYIMTVMLIPVTMVAAGWYWNGHAPKRINSGYGYRTKRSMRDLDSWRFAHRTIANLWLRVGGVLLVLSIVALIAISRMDESAIGWWVSGITLVQLCVMVLPIWPTERALKRHQSNEEGKESR
ncbi:SdpI family protein [Eubacteriales bacterium OttesenSCG-928-N14]|nr:SdpI family protein [Eubacteriales bacterium OttesenSCG-928-N14]